MQISDRAQHIVVTSSSPPSPAAFIGLRRYIEGPRVLSWIGFGLLLAWLCWLGISIIQQPLPRAVPHQRDYLKDRLTYIIFVPFMGLDFHNNYAAVRAWRQGSDPYTELRGDPGNTKYVYPPLTLVAFSWVDLFPPGPSFKLNGENGAESVFVTSVAAILTWMAAIVGIVSLAACKSWSTRKRLGLPPLPLPFVLGAALASYPVIFELERGNCNVLPLLAIIVLVAALEWPDRQRGDAVAGLCVAIATGIKPYALVLLLGLFAFRRYRAAAFAIGCLILQAIIFSPDLRRWIAVALVENQTQIPIYLDFSHSIIGHWQLLWRDLGWPGLAQVPAQWVVGCMLLVATLTVSWHVFRRAAGTAVAWPFLLWLTGAATMAFPIANDYNLLFIPLAVMGAWSAADSWRVQLCVCAVLLWWQPFYIGLTSLPWLLLKAMSLLFVGVLILRRLQSSPAPVSSPVRRIFAAPGMPDSHGFGLR